MIYERLAKRSMELIAKYGQDVFFIDTSGVSINPVTGETTGTETSTTVKGIDRPLSVISNSLNTQELLVGTRITGSMRVLIIGGAYKPGMSDKVLYNGEYWKITKINEINPAGIPLTYFVVIDK